MRVVRPRADRSSIDRTIAIATSRLGRAMRQSCAELRNTQRMNRAANCGCSA